MAVADPMMQRRTRRARRRASRWVPWSGRAAVGGALCWTVAPWLQRLALGTRPYVATAFDVGTFLGLVLVAAGVVGLHATASARSGRLGRAGIGALAVGVALLAALAFRATLAFVAAGFRRVPATGEDPAGLLLTFVAVAGYGLATVGCGLFGAALWRREGVTAVAAACVLAPFVPIALITFRLAGLLSLAVGTVVVGTTVAFVPLGVAWAALGWVVLRRSRRPADGRRASLGGR